MNIFVIWHGGGYCVLYLSSKLKSNIKSIFMKLYEARLSGKRDKKRMWLTFVTCLLLKTWGPLVGICEDDIGQCERGM